MMFSQQICDKKRALRRELLQKASALLPENGDIAKAVLASPEWQNAKAVFCYVSHKYEPNTMPLLLAALASGKTLCVPLCEDNGVMHAVKIQSLTALHKGAYGILEPPLLAKKIEPLQIDLAIIPCLAADKNKNRLGKGGGYYDRFLAKCSQNCIKLLLCRAELLLDNVPCEEHDIKADILL